MAIQMRRGNETDFNAARMLPGEWAVSTDKKIVRMCFAPGVCLRMATYESFESDMKIVRQIVVDCQNIQEAIERIQEEIGIKSVEVETNARLAAASAQTATDKASEAQESASNADRYAQTATAKAIEATEAAALSNDNAQTSAAKAREAEVSAQNARQFSIQSSESAQTATQKATEIVGQAERAEAASTEAESYARGGTGSRSGEDMDNASYYKEQAAIEAARAEAAANRAEAVAGIDIMTVDKAGIGKPDGTTISVSLDGTMSATKDYTVLENKPSIGGNELSGNKTLEELGIQPKGEYLTEESTISFSPAEKRDNISAGDTIKTIFGKLAKWLSDLKVVAFSGSYNDLSNKPDIPSKTSELTNDMGYVNTGNTIYTFDRNGNPDGTYSDDMSAELRNIGMSLDLSFQENMNLLKKINIRGATASISISINFNASEFNNELPVSSGGILTVEHPKGTRRIFIFDDYRTGKRYINFDLDGTYDTWRMINPTPTNNLLATIAGSPLDATQGKVLNEKIGLLSSLTTNVKTSIVAAINNLNTKLDFYNVIPAIETNFSNLKEFVSATNSRGNANPKIIRIKDTGGWGPDKVINAWYRVIVMYQNPYREGSSYDVQGSVLLFGGVNVYGAYIGTITGSYDNDNLAITYKKIQTTDL